VPMHGPAVVDPLARKFAEDPVFRKTIFVSVRDRMVEEALDPTGSRRASDLVGGLAHQGLMAVTPAEYQDDVNAFLYYGMLGMLDPKNPADAKVYSRTLGVSYGKGLGIALIGGFFFWGTVGWAIDWEDKREGGLAETEWYKKWTNPESYSLPSGW